MKSIKGIDITIMIISNKARDAKNPLLNPWEPSLDIAKYIIIKYGINNKILTKVINK